MTLAGRLEAAPAGDPGLSLEAFLALGGELRRERVGKQGPTEATYAYWPGERDPVMGVSLTTNVGDVLHEVTRRGVVWCMGSTRGGMVVAIVGGTGATAATPALALCAAAVRRFGGDETSVAERRSETDFSDDGRMSCV